MYLLSCGVVELLSCGYADEWIGGVVCVLELCSCVGVPLWCCGVVE